MKRSIFKAFQCAAPYAFCEKEHWFIPDRDKSWDIFIPALEKYNDRRRQLLQTILIILDESMSGWKPKTSQFGGLPNITHESRKPVDLGTMLRNSIECITGIMRNQDVVQCPEAQMLKKYYNADASYPPDTKIQVHTAEVLRLVENSTVESGGWVGGDSWFGSISTAVEVITCI